MITHLLIKLEIVTKVNLIPIELKIHQINKPQNLELNLVSNVSLRSQQNKLPSKQKLNLVMPGNDLDNSNLVGHIQGIIVRCQPDISLLGPIRPATE